jgi:gliding motility-associated-like protein
VISAALPKVFPKFEAVKLFFVSLFLFFGTVFGALNCSAGSPPVAFVPNLGQWQAPHAFQATFGDATVFFLESEVRLLLNDAHQVHELQHRPSTENAVTLLNLHALKIDFPGSKVAKPEAAGDKSIAPFSYFLGDKSAVTFPTNALLYPQLYDGIDMLWKAGNNQLKYDFVVHPGANPANIQIRYQGGDAIRLLDGRLQVSTSLGYWYEEAPYAYQLQAGQKVAVPCHFVLKNGVVTFAFPKGYDRTQTLTIDPTLVFSTYSGAGSNNFGYTAAPDIDGNMYTAGTIFGSSFPVTIGAYQDTFIGPAPSTDIGILKFDPTGTTLVYATFFGGNRVEYPHSIIVNDQRELLMMGSTTGGTFPSTGNAYDPTHNGGSDIFVSKFSADGTQLLSSTFFGGSDNDGLNIAAALRKNQADQYRGDIMLASNGDIVIASATASTGLATAGTFQPAYGGGGQDGLIARFNSSLSQLRWCTYLGGNQDDALYGLKEGISGEVIAVGGSNSPNLTLPGFGFQTSNAGGVDGVIVRLEALTGLGITGTFLGSQGYDQLFFVDTDELGTVYVTGHTDSNLITLNTNYNDPRSGQYIANFSNQLGTLNWLGRFGSRGKQPDLHLAAFVVDLCQNIYVSGYTGNMGPGGAPGPLNLQTTNNAAQRTSDGYDFYLAAFSPAMLTLQYGTYFGGPISEEHVDGGTSRFDKRGVMYQAICAGCQGNSDLPVTPNAYATSNGSTGCNNAAVKLAFQLESGLGVNFGWTPPPTYCAPLTLQMEDYSRVVSNTSWLWVTSKGDSSTLPNPQFSFPEPGNYSISLRISSPDACNGFDTLTRYITVFDLPALQLPEDTCICVEDGYQLTANVEGSSYVWSGAGSGNERSIQPVLSGMYKLDLIDANGCDASDSINVEVITCFGEVPNVITPNGDGNNDRITLPGNEFAEFELRAFNRWGQEVFSTTNQQLGWGGEQGLGGQLVKPGDYYIRIKAKFCQDRIIERNFPLKVLY